MKNKSGFTLMELLAVIVIISIVSVITVFLISDEIERSREKAAYDSAFGIKRALDSYYISFDMSGMVFHGYSCIFPDNCNEINIDGKVPTSGSLLLDKDGNVSGYVVYDQYIYSISSDGINMIDSIP